MPTASAELNYIQNNVQSFFSLVHISTFEPTVGVILNFSSPVYHVIAQAGVVPYMEVEYMYDPLGRTHIEQWDVSSIVIPALGAQVGVISTDFYALVYSKTTSTSPPSVTVTASTIAISTHEYNPDNNVDLSLSVSISPAPQILRIPFHNYLQVLSTEVQFSDRSCVDNSINASSVFYYFNIYLFFIIYLV